MIYEFAATQPDNQYGGPWPAGMGPNLIDPETLTRNKKINYDNGELQDDTRFCVSDYLAIDFSSSYYAYNIARAWYSTTGAIYDENKEFLSAYNRGGSDPDLYYRSEISFPSPPEGSYYLRLCYVQSQDPEFGLNTPATVTTFKPWENEIMPEGFNMWDPENAEYVQLYAGYVNSNTRELLLRPVYTEYNGEELVGPWMSSLDEYDEDTTPTEGAFVIDFGGELTSFEITPFMLQTLLDSLGIRQHFLDGASLLNSLMDQAQGRVRSEAELLNRSKALKVIPIGDQLPEGIKIKAVSKDVLPGLPGKFIR